MRDFLNAIAAGDDTIDDRPVFSVLLDDRFPALERFPVEEGNSFTGENNEGRETNEGEDRKRSFHGGFGLRELCEDG